MNQNNELYNNYINNKNTINKYSNQNNEEYLTKVNNYISPNKNNQENNNSKNNFNNYYKINNNNQFSNNLNKKATPIPDKYKNYFPLNKSNNYEDFKKNENSNKFNNYQLYQQDTSNFIPPTVHHTNSNSTKENKFFEISIIFIIFFKFSKKER